MKLMLNLSCASQLCQCDLIKYTINIVLCLDTCKPIYFKLGVMLDTSNLYSLIPASVTLVFTQGHGATGKLELVQSFIEKPNEATQLFTMLDYAREMTVKYVFMSKMDRLSICFSSFLTYYKQIVVQEVINKSKWDHFFNALLSQG